MFTELDRKSANTIRTLAADVVSKANSGHPGAPMGLAPTAHCLFHYFMRFNPANPEWFARDRFILSNGHACALQYVLLHLYGNPTFNMDELKKFRQVGSNTPGHPEYELSGVEMTTGPLGQGISNAVGLAMAEAHMAAVFNKPGFNIVDNYTYCILGDGCLMEGVASEAMALAGHLQLGKLIAFWDDNRITIDGDTAVAFTEDVQKRMESYGWHTIHVKDGNEDTTALYNAIEEAKKETSKPTLIRIETIIGYGSLQQGTHGVHGSPLKAEDIGQLKERFGFDKEKSFDVAQDVYDYYKKRGQEGQKAEQEWAKLLESYKEKYPKEHAEFERRSARKLPENWESKLPTYTPKDKDVATRKLSEIVLTSIHEVLPELIGGSADLTGSNLTRWPDAVDFQPESTGLGSYNGRYIRYGVREHGMGAIMNGLSAYGGLIAYGGTFLNFVSYASGAVRLSALSGHQVIWVATHDSIGLGEDGPTHQPIETLAHLRAIPNLMVWRPADGNEVSGAYKVAIEQQHTPSVIALSRQNLPNLKGTSIEKTTKGGYVLVDCGEKPELVIAATGSEVHIAVAGADIIAKEGIKVNVVSLPDFLTFDQQSKEYQLSVFPDGVPAMSVEVLSAYGWSKYTHEHFNIDHFGVSGPAGDIYKAFDFTPEGVAKRARLTHQFYKGQTVRSRLIKAFESFRQNGPGPFPMNVVDGGLKKLA